MFCLPVCLCSTRLPSALEVTRKCWIPWGWGYRWLWAEYGFWESNISPLARTRSVFICWTNSPPLYLLFISILYASLCTVGAMQKNFFNIKRWQVERVRPCLQECHPWDTSSPNDIPTPDSGLNKAEHSHHSQRNSLKSGETQCVGTSGEWTWDRYQGKLLNNWCCVTSS